ncbi:MAG: thermonuclease family protein, partial [Nitrosopumilaceae archaeon]
VVDSYKIRLSLTNTPEKSENGFKEATSFTSKLCPVGSTVTVDQDDKQPTDKYKRIVGKVFCSEKILNAELLYNDHANILTKYCSKSEFANESWAKRFGC